METTLSAKEASLKLIARLDDDVTYEEIMSDLKPSKSYRSAGSIV